VSEATDLVPKNTNALADIFVRDIQAGATLLGSPGARSTNPTIPIGSSEAPEISADARYVAFLSTATNLVPGVRSSGEIYVRDLQEGRTILASAGARQAMFQVTGGSNNVISYNAAMSRDGRFVVYEASTNSAPRGLILRFDLIEGTTDIVATNAIIPTAARESDRNLGISSD
jgi:hypothetical protein